jgi:hypothetical protein
LKDYWKLQETKDYQRYYSELLLLAKKDDESAESQDQSVQIGGISTQGDFILMSLFYELCK